MPIKEKLAELDEIGSVNPLAKAIDGLTGIVDRLTKGDANGRIDGPTDTKVKGGSANGRIAGPTETATRSKQPNVTPKGKAQASMGGSPEAKRAVSDDELGDDSGTAGEEPEDGKGRISAARSKAKAKVDGVSTGALGKSFKPGAPPPVDDGDADDAGGEYADDEPDEAPEDGDDDQDAEDTGDAGEAAPGQDGDEQMAPQLAQLLLALAQNPQLLQVLSQVAGGGAAPQMGMAPGGGGMAGGAPPAMGAGGPPPEMGAGTAPGMGDVPPHSHEQDPSFMRSMSGHIDGFEKALRADPRAGQMLEAIDASPALEAFADHMMTAFAKCLAAIERVERIEQKFAKAVSARLDVIEEGFAKSLTVSGAMAKSMLDSTPKPPVEFPSPGVLTPFGKALTPAGREGDIDRVTMSKAMNAAARAGDREAVGLLKYIDGVPGGLDVIRNRASDALWERYTSAL